MQPELIKAHGYIPETHHIWTEDGYCLNVHRVLSPRDQVSIKADSIINTDTAVIDNSSKDSNLSTSPDCHRVLEALEYADSRLPVIVSHGLISSSADWVLLGPQKALGNYSLLILFLSFYFFIIYILVAHTRIFFDGFNKFNDQQRGFYGMKIIY